MAEGVGAHPLLRTVTDRGESISLRSAQLGDAEAIVVAFTDPLTQALTTIPPDFEPAHAVAHIANAAGWWQRGEGVRWVIADSQDAYVGTLDLRRNPADPEAAEVFFLTAPHARGRGYMSAALRAAAVWGIKELGLVRVEWRALVGNEGSRRAAEKAGFRPEGIARQSCNQRGKRYDAWVAALTNEDL